MVAAIVSFAIGGQVVSPITAVAQEEQPPQGTVACGQVVQGMLHWQQISIVLGRIDCRDDETTINLNGFGIYGPGADSSKVGIGASEDNVVVNGPGTISGFQAGILATGAKALAANSLIMQDNQMLRSLQEQTWPQFKKT